MTNEQMAIEVQQGRDADGSILMALWDGNQGYIHAIVKNYDGLIEESDAMQEAFIGLMSSIPRWDSERGVPFMVFAGNWIRAAVSRSVEKSRGVSVNMQSKVRQLHKLEDDFQQMYNRKPSDAEISDLLDISENELASIKQAEIAQNNASLDAPYSEDEELSLADVVPSTDDVEGDAVDAVENQQLHDALWDEVDRLPEDQADTLHKRYGDQLTAKQVGELTGRSGQQIADIERKALVKMRTTPRTRERLLPFWSDDRIRSGSLRGNGAGTFQRTWTSSTEKTALKIYRRSE